MNEPEEKEQIIENADGSVQVLSSKGDKYYTVKPNGVCNCPSSIYHSTEDCKHTKFLVEKGYFVKIKQEDL